MKCQGYFSWWNSTQRMAGNYDGTLSGAYSIWHGGGQQETDQTVLTITKALTNTTNCAFIAKKRNGTTKKNFRRFTPDQYAPPFKFVLATLCTLQVCNNLQFLQRWKNWNMLTTTMLNWKKNGIKIFVEETYKTTPQNQAYSSPPLRLR